MWILISLIPAATFLVGFLCGIRVVLVRYVPVDKVQVSDLYPTKGSIDGK